MQVVDIDDPKRLNILLQDLHGIWMLADAVISAAVQRQFAGML